VQDDAVRRRDLTHPLGRRDDCETPVAHGRHLDAGFREKYGEPIACGRANGGRPGGLRLHLRHRRVLDELPTVDDHDVVDRLRHLREDVTRDENRPALPGERAEEVTEPADSLRVEAVRRLVEHEHLRIAEKSGGEPQSLAHAERVALHAPASRRAHVDHREDLVDARPRDAPGEREHPQVVAPRAPRMGIERLEQHADAPDGVLELGVRPAEDRGPARSRADEAEKRTHRRRLARAVRAEEPRDPTGLDGEGEVVDGERRAEPLREALDLDHLTTLT
jgi:hypothetical protein